MLYRISGYRDAVTMQQWPTAAISIYDTNLQLTRGTTGTPYHYAFVWNEDHKPCGEVLIEAEYYARRIGAYAVHLPKDARLLIHCTHGISRSPAVALGVLTARGMPACKAVESVFARYPDSYPNLDIVAAFARVYGAPELLALVNDRIS